MVDLWVLPNPKTPSMWKLPSNYLISRGVWNNFLIFPFPNWYIFCIFYKYFNSFFCLSLAGHTYKALQDLWMFSGNYKTKCFYIKFQKTQEGKEGVDWKTSADHPWLTKFRPRRPTRMQLSGSNTLFITRVPLKLEARKLSHGSLLALRTLNMGQLLIECAGRKTNFLHNCWRSAI